MERVIVIVSALLMVIGCTQKETHRALQTFALITVDMVKIDKKDYTELTEAVNTNYAPQKREFVDARLLKEEGMFLYFHVYSSVNTACYRVTVDKNRSKIINIQPDCAIEE